MKLSKTEYRCNACMASCTLKMEVDAGKPDGCPFDSAGYNWKRQEPKSELPKLTAEVFDWSDCPEWAEYAAVDKNGHVYVFDLEPECTHSSWYKKTRFGFRLQLSGSFDSSDYEHSLVRRTEQKQKLQQKQKPENELPGWCKPDEWIWDDEDQRYLKVLRITDTVLLSTVSGLTYYEEFIDIKRHYKEARLRLYSPDEMSSLVGKVLHHSTGAYLVTGFENRWNQVKIESVWREAVELKDLWTWLDGTPCGMLEHLNEKGSWENDLL